MLFRKEDKSKEGEDRVEVKAEGESGKEVILEGGRRRGESTVDRFKI